MTASAVALTVDALGELKGIRHGFFTRTGGVSEGLYVSLNCGFSAGDDPEMVAVNRDRAMAAFDRTADALATVCQVHGARVAAVERPWSHRNRPVADGLVSGVPGVVLGVLTADCAPGEVTACVQPGTYYLFLSSAIEERNLRAGVPCPSCAEDLNGDGLVGPFDLALLLGNWGPCPPGDDCPADFTEDDEVGPLDLAILLDAWGPCGQPPEAIWGNDYVATLNCTPCGN